MSAAPLGRAQRAWLAVYTVGMDPGVARERADEMASDAWEHAQALAVAAVGPRRAALLRAVRAWRGMPADVGWRVGLGRSGIGRAAELSLAAALAVGVALALPVAVVVGRGSTGDGTGGGPWDAAALVTVLAAVAGGVIPGVVAARRHPRLAPALALVGGAAVALSLAAPAMPALAATAALTGLALRPRRPDA